jgi:hypothetical protein
MQVLLAGHLSLADWMFQDEAAGSCRTRRMKRLPQALTVVRFFAVGRAPEHEAAHVELECSPQNRHEFRPVPVSAPKHFRVQRVRMRLV